MTLFWKDYRGGPRIAKVRNELGDGVYNNLEYSTELLHIRPGHISFSSDGYSTTISEPDSRFYLLMTGDVITTDDRGVIYQLFSVEENDATLFITGHCNSNCIMCPASDSERKQDGGMTDEWMRQYLSMLPDNTGHITVTGGEPTLRTEIFFEMMERIANRFPEVETLLLTNGRSFASLNIVNRLIAYCPQYLRVAIPIHASTALLHDRITQAPGSFEQTCMGVNNLTAKGIAVELRVVVSKLNCYTLTNIAEYIVQHLPKALVVNFIGLETRGSCAKNSKEVFVDLQESARLILPAINILAKAGIDAALYNYPLCMVDRGYWALCKRSISPDKMCFADSCNTCEAKSFCGGFFNTTLSMTKPTVYPIHL